MRSDSQKSCPSLLCYEIRCNGCLFNDHAEAAHQISVLQMEMLQRAVEVCTDGVPSMSRVESSHVSVSYLESQTVNRLVLVPRAAAPSSAYPSAPCLKR